MHGERGHGAPQSQVMGLGFQPIDLHREGISWLIPCGEQALSAPVQSWTGYFSYCASVEAQKKIPSRVGHNNTVRKT